MNFEVIPLFSLPLIGVQISEDMSALNSVKEEDFAEKSDISESNNSFATKNLSFLDTFPQEKNILNRYFQQFVTEVLGYPNISFKMTTSWGTKTLPGGYCQRHSHHNCLYSGVFYIEDVTEGGRIEFTNSQFPHGLIYLGQPTHCNAYNTSSWKIQPRQHSLFIFPSQLEHAILPYTGTKPRYSIAMNWAPEGLYGMGDSQINTRIQSIYENSAN